MLEDVLFKKGIKQTDLTPEEKETLAKWQDQLKHNKLGIEDVEDHVNDMIIGIERELSTHKVPETFVAMIFRRKRNAHLMARLQNYLMIREMLESPRKTKERMEKQLENLKINEQT